MPRKKTPAIMICILPIIGARKKTTSNIATKPIMAPREPVRKVVARISNITPTANTLPGGVLGR